MSREEHSLCRLRRQHTNQYGEECVDPAIQCSSFSKKGPIGSTGAFPPCILGPPNISHIATSNLPLKKKSRTLDPKDWGKGILMCAHTLAYTRTSMKIQQSWSKLLVRSLLGPRPLSPLLLRHSFFSYRKYVHFFERTEFLFLSPCLRLLVVPLFLLFSYIAASRNDCG